MSPPAAAARPHVLVLTRWDQHAPEYRFVLRSLAGALSRHASVAVAVPGPAGSTRADGLFDLCAVGRGSAGGWPDPDAARWPVRAVPDAVLLDSADLGARRLAEAHAPGAAVLGLAGSHALLGPGGTVVATSEARAAAMPGPVHRVDVCVPVNPLAARRPHNALGFTGYLLVLSDRPGSVPADPGSVPPAPAAPTALAAWLTARFARADVVVVEGGRAAVWRSRALRGVVGVDSRTDLWRLMAHAAVVVDLAPGTLVARECVEALRFGTPIVVPAGTTGAEHARGGGGLCYDGVASLLDAVDRLGVPARRQEVASRGRRLAERRFGRPELTVAQMADALTAALAGADPGAPPVGHRPSPR